MWTSSLSEKSFKKQKNVDLRTLMNPANLDRFKKPELPKLSRTDPATGGYKRKHSTIETVPQKLSRLIPISRLPPRPTSRPPPRPINRPVSRPSSSSSWIESCNVTRTLPPNNSNSSNSWPFPSFDLDMSQSQLELPPRPPTAMSISQGVNPSHDSSSFSISQMLGLPLPSPPKSIATTTSVSSIPRYFSSAYLARGLQPALPQGIETNPGVTKRYSVQELMDILCGFTPIPEEDMFTGGPLKARYYEEQCEKNTKENSIYQSVPQGKSKATRRQLLADFEEASSFSINIAPRDVDICNSSPLHDISNVGRDGWRPTTARPRGQVRFFLDTQDEQEQDYGEKGFLSGPLLTPVKKTYFNDLDGFPSTPVSTLNDVYSQNPDSLF